jgi:hypothetical protein
MNKSIEIILIKNNSIIQNESSKFLMEPQWSNSFLGLILIAISLITIFGNSLVIIAVISERNLKSATNYYIISLAVADLLVGLVVMPFNSLNQMTNNYWFFGDLW